VVCLYTKCVISIYRHALKPVQKYFLQKAGYFKVGQGLYTPRFTAKGVENIH